MGVGPAGAEKYGHAHDRRWLGWGKESTPPSLEDEVFCLFDGSAKDIGMKRKMFQPGLMRRAKSAKFVGRLFETVVELQQSGLTLCAGTVNEFKEIENVNVHLFQ